MSFNKNRKISQGRRLRLENLEERRVMTADIQLVNDVNTSVVGSNPSSFTSVGAITYFAATSPLEGRELWRTDGTAAGTSLVKDINPSYNHADEGPRNLISYQGKLLFTEYDGSGTALWSSNGTEAGTVKFKDHFVAIGQSEISSFVNFNGTLYFTATDSHNNATGPNTVVSLWKSDGTTAGTSLVKAIDLGDAYIYQHVSLTNANGTLFLVPRDGTNNSELWKSDGTAAGTVLVNSIARADKFTNSHLSNLQGTVLFNVDSQLWTSDGTAAGTKQITTVSMDHLQGNPFIELKGSLLFDAADTQGTEHLWKSDGTAAGTTVLKDINVESQPYSQYPSYNSHFTNVSGTLYFNASDASHDGLWKSDGTAAGTVAVSNISALSPVNVNGTLFFAGSNANKDVELWKSNGLAAGTVRVKDIVAGTNSSNPFALANIQGTLYFAATTPQVGAELWKSNGTAAGTTLIKDIYAANGNSSPHALTSVNGNLFYLDANALWKSNSASGKTFKVHDFDPTKPYYPSSLTAVGTTLFFVGYDKAHGAELWKSDGTIAGTTLVKDILPGVGFKKINNMKNVNGVLFFETHYHDVVEYWKSNGTAAGTVQVSNPNPLTIPTLNPPLIRTSNPFELNGTLYFAANQGNQNSTLWKSDGTVAGTVQVKDIYPGQDSRPEGFTNLNGTLFFSARSASGIELWKSDGTTAGTVQVKDIYPGAGSSSPVTLTNVGGTLYFSANDSVHGRELWKSDGTAAGTVLIKDLHVGSQPSFPFSFTKVGNDIYFAALGANNITELWKTDGTSTGTVQVVDQVAPLPLRINGDLTNVNGILYFTAIDDVHGLELFRLINK